MEVRGSRQKELTVLTGSQPHVSEVLSRRRPLALQMIRSLAVEWKLAAEARLPEYACDAAVGCRFRYCGPTTLADLSAC